MPDTWNESNSIEVTVNGTASATLNDTINPKTAFQLVSFSLDNGSSPATSEGLTITLTREAAAASDTVVFRQDMLSVDDIYESFDSDDMRMVAGDKIDLDWTNTNTVTYKYTLKYRRIA